MKLEITEDSYQWMLDRLALGIDNFYDDPYGTCDDWPDEGTDEKRKQGIRDHHGLLQNLAKEFDVSFEDIVAKWTTDYEQTRINNILNAASVDLCVATEKCCECGVVCRLVDNLECKDCTSEPPQFWEPDKSIKAKEVGGAGSRIFWLNISTRQELASTFLRFQEYYESPEFASKIFTLQEFRKWYKGDDKEFTYYDDWSGFNVPSWVLDPFREGKFLNVSSREQWLLDLFKDQDGKFYIIGTCGKDDTDQQTLKHEIAHGMFYVNAEYKEKVLNTLKGLTKDSASKIRQYLIGDYHENSIIDETHAYVLEGMELLGDEGIEGDDIKDVSTKLNAIYEKYRR